MKIVITSTTVLLGTLGFAVAQQSSTPNGWWRAITEAERSVGVAAKPKPPAEVYSAFGLTGTWSSACDRPASTSNGRATYRPVEGGGLVVETDYGGTAPARTTIRTASVDGEGRLHATGVSTFTELPVSLQAQVGKNGARPGVTFASVFAKGPDGSVTIVEAAMTPDGSPTEATVVGGSSVNLQTRLPGPPSPPRFACRGQAQPKLSLPRWDFGLDGKSAPPEASTAAPPASSLSVTALGSDGYLAENLRIARSKDVVVVPRIELRGTSLSREEVLRLLDRSDPAGPADRLLALNAREVVVPEIRIEGGEGLLSLRDLRLSNVAGGRMDSITLGGGAMTPPGAENVTFERMEANGLDLRLLLSLPEPAPTGARTAPGMALERFALEGVSFSRPGDLTLRIARLSGRDYRVRQTASGWKRSLDDAFGGLDDGAAPGRVRQASAAAADLMGSLDLGSLEMTGLELSQAGGKPMTLRLAAAGFSTGGRGGEIRFDGLDIKNAEGTVRLSSFVLGGLSLAGAVDGLRAIAVSSSDEIGPAAARRLMPQIGTMRLGRLDADLPGAAEGPVKLGIDSVELAASDFRNGVPASVRFVIGDLTIPIEAAAAQDPSGQLGALGLDTIGLSFRTDLGWSEGSQEFALREMSLALKDVGTVTLRGTVGDVTKDVFDPDTAVATVAALGISVRSLDIDIQDRGGTQRVIKAMAAQQGVSVDDVRTEAAAYAVIGIPPLLGGTASAKALAHAVGRFITKPGRLRVRVQAKQPAGLAVSDIAASQDPAGLLNKVEITAVAD